jgi:hypothetical protein
VTTNVRGDMRRALARVAAVTLTFGTLTACENLLQVETPSRVPFDAFLNPANADLLVTSVKTDFECAFGIYIVAGGLIGDEWQDSQLAAALWPYDRRTSNPSGDQYATSGCTGGQTDVGLYTPLQTALFLGDTATVILSGFSDLQVTNRAEKIAIVRTYAAYAVLLLGEAMCSAAIHSGPELTSAQLFAVAEQRFDTVLAGALPGTTISNFALVGRARARLNQGKTAEAVTDATAVPPGRLNAGYAATLGTRESNRIERMNVVGTFISVEEDFRGLTVNPDGTHGQGAGTPDPRVDVYDANRLGQDQTTRLWRQRKYTTRDAPIRLASYEEAQLIIAEIQLGQTAVDVINALHGARGLPLWTPINVNDTAEVLSHVIDERRRELYLESHHYFDKRRFHALAAARGVPPAQLSPNLPYTPPMGAQFVHGGFYGDQRCLPLPDVERLNNPNIP